MKKYAVVISIVAVFAILSISIAVAPTYQNPTDTAYSVFDLDPIIDAAIENDVNEAFSSNIEESRNEEPKIASASSNNELPLASGQDARVNVTLLYEEISGGRRITGYFTNSNQSFTELTIGSSGTSSDYIEIADGAFRNCKTLTSLNIANSKLQKIGLAAFYGCTALTTITNNSFPSTLEYIGGYAFANTPWLISQRGGADAQTKAVVVNNIIIDGVKAEGTNGKVEIASTIKAISPYAFAYNYTMTTLSFEERTSGFIDIPYRAFSACTKLKAVSLSNVKSIAAYAFSDCTALTEVKNFDNSFTGFGNSAFAGCTALNKCDYSSCSGADVFTIGDHAFMDCTSLESVAFPLHITTIGTAAFMRCKGISTISFNASTTYVTIKQAAFKDCTKLETIEKDAGTTFGYGSSTGMTTEAQFKSNVFRNTKITSI